MSGANEAPRNPLLGKWKYVDCAVKNTGVEGAVDFLPDATFTFAGKIHEDFPTRPFRRTYRYEVDGRRFTCLTKDYPALEYPPVAGYFLVQGDSLYFSNLEMSSAEDDWTGSYRKTNWSYRLIRVGGSAN